MSEKPKCTMCGVQIDDGREEWFCDRCLADPRVVVHLDEWGEISVFADEGIEVYWVDERAPNDRIYKMNRTPVPDDMLRGTIGRHKDGSAADVRAHAVVAKFEGQPHLSVVASNNEGEL